MAARDTGLQPVVLHLISSLKIGGAERLLVSTMNAARGQASSRYVVVVMNEAVDPGLMHELKASGVAVYHLARREGHLHPRYMLEILRVVRRHGVEVIHTHNDGSLAWGMLAKLAMPRLKLVYTQHEQGGAPKIRGLRRRVYRRLVDMTVAISPFIAEETRAVSGHKVVLIENGVDLAKFEGAPRHDWLNQPVRLVQVGRFAPVKGQDILLHAIRAGVDRGLDLHCTLVGALSDRAYFDELQALVRQLDLHNRVYFEIDRTDVERVFEQQDIFVLSSREEGFGIAIIEAMAANLPVIVPAVGGARNIVQHGENGLLFEVGNATDLAGQLATMIGTAGLPRRLADAGAITARRFDIRRTLDAKSALYRALTSPARAATAGRSASGAHGVEARALSEMP